MSITKVFLADSGWAYDGIKQTIGALQGLSDRNEKTWTLLGALLFELCEAGIKEAVIYNDTRLVEEWNEDVQFVSPLSKRIAARLKDKDGLARRFLTLSLEKLDRVTIDSQIKETRLT